MTNDMRELIEIASGSLPNPNIPDDRERAIFILKFGGTIVE